MVATDNESATGKRADDLRSHVLVRSSEMRYVGLGHEVCGLGTAFALEQVDRREKNQLDMRQVERFEGLTHNALESVRSKPKLVAGASFQVLIFHFRVTATLTERPDTSLSRSGWPGSIVIFTGTRCTTFVKFPV